MSWYRITLCVALCFLQFAPSESRPSDVPVDAPETSNEDIKPSDVPLDVPETTHGHNEDDYTTVLVEAKILLHVYENGTVTESDSTQVTKILLEGEKEKALTGANSTFTVQQTEEISGDAVGDKSTNDTVTTLILTALIEAEIPKTDNVTATADTSVTFISDEVSQTETLSSAASINGGILEDEKTEETTKEIEDYLANGKEIVLNDGSSIILHVNIQLDSNNATTRIETDMTNMALVTIDEGNVTVTTDSKTNTAVTSNEENDDGAGNTTENQSDSKTQDQNEATDDTTVADDSVEGTQAEAIIRTDSQAITIVRSNDGADEEHGNKEVKDAEDKNVDEDATELEFQ